MCICSSNNASPLLQGSSREDLLVQQQTVSGEPNCSGTAVNWTTFLFLGITLNKQLQTHYATAHWIKTREKGGRDRVAFCFFHFFFTPTPSSFPSFTFLFLTLFSSFSLSQQSRSGPLIIPLFLFSLRLTLTDKYSSLSRQQRDCV